MLAAAGAFLTSTFDALYDIPAFQFLIDTALDSSLFDEVAQFGWSVGVGAVNFVMDDFNNLRESGYGVIGATGLTILDAIGNSIGTENFANALEGRNRAGDK